VSFPIPCFVMDAPKLWGLGPVSYIASSCCGEDRLVNEAGLQAGIGDRSLSCPVWDIASCGRDLKFV
jgi:hypothetical protein